jgi:hypothetical protein
VAIGTAFRFRIQGKPIVWRGSGRPWPPHTVTHFADRPQGLIGPFGDRLGHRPRWQIAGSNAVEDFVYVSGGTAKAVAQIDSITD